MDKFEFELLDAFTKPIIDDATWDHPALRDKEIFMMLMVERNNEGLCGYPRCSNKVPIPPKATDQPIFCSNECFRKFKNRFVINKAKKRNPIGNVVEKFADQKPPKELNHFQSDQIEGMQVRSGDYADILNEIEKWVGDIPAAGFIPLNYKQKIIKEIVQRGLKTINITLKDVPDVNFYFVNLDVRDLEKLQKSPEVFQTVFAFAMWEVISGTDMTNEIKHLRFSMEVYDDLVQILGQMEPDLEDLYEF